MPQGDPVLRHLCTASEHSGAAESSEIDPLTRYAHLWLAYKAATAAKGLLYSLLEEADEAAQNVLVSEGATRGKRLDALPVVARLGREVWANTDRQKDEPTRDAYARACAALRASGHGDFAQDWFNSKSLTSYVRGELKDDPDWSPPEEWAGAIKVSERLRTRITKG